MIERAYVIGCLLAGFGWTVLFLWASDRRER